MRTLTVRAGGRLQPPRKAEMGVSHNHRTMGSEVRLAIRRLAKEPALALAAVLTLALGIGACTAMFSIVEAVLLKSMDIAQPQRLVVMWPQFGDTAGEFSYNAYLELSRQSATFERVALSGSANWPVPVDILLPDGRRTRATQCAVSDTFFDVLGARPLLGRTFHAGEDRPGAPLGDRRERRILEDEARRRSGSRRPHAGDRPRRLENHRRHAAGVLLSRRRRLLDARRDAPGSHVRRQVTCRARTGLQYRRSVPRARPAEAWRVDVTSPDGCDAPLDDHEGGHARHASRSGLSSITSLGARAARCGCSWARSVSSSSSRARMSPDCWSLATRSARASLPCGALWARRHGSWSGKAWSRPACSPRLAASAGMAIAGAALRGLIALSPATVVRLSETRVDAVVLAACLLMTGGGDARRCLWSRQCSRNGPP